MFFSTELTYLRLNGLNAINCLLFPLASFISLALVLYIVYLLKERPEGVLVLGLPLAPTSTPPAFKPPNV
jgi:Kef-type K+ transport system membrane component KefB